MKCILEQEITCISYGTGCKFKEREWACANYRHYLMNQKQKKLFQDYFVEVDKLTVQTMFGAKK